MGAIFNWINAESRCLVITAYAEGLDALRDQVAEWSYDLILCADGRQFIARELGLAPEAYIGDFDSSCAPQGCRVDLPGIASEWEEKLQDLNCGNQMLDSVSAGEPLVFVLPSEKDITDAEAAVGIAVCAGIRHIDILGGFGGRFDHAMGNVGLLVKYANTPVRLRIFDGLNSVTLAEPGTHVVARGNYTYFGVIPYGRDASGVSLESVKYPVCNATLSAGSTLGVSNEINGTATVRLRQGLVLLVQSNDAPQAAG